MSHTPLPAASRLTLRPAVPADFAGIWPIFEAVVAAGDTYPYPPDMPYEAAERLWMTQLGDITVAEQDGRIVGTYYLKPNQLGLGSHVANAGYMVHPDTRGQGIGRALGEHSLDNARAQGYTAMQFNLVVVENIASVRLWESLGFSILATLPKAFRRADGRLVDAYLMHRFL